MRLGRVVGKVWCTRKALELKGCKLLAVEVKGEKEAWICADGVGAGRGETVLLSTGAAARLAVGDTGAAVDAAVVAIVDDMEMGEEG